MARVKVCGWCGRSFSHGPVHHCCSEKCHREAYGLSSHDAKSKLRKGEWIKIFRLLVWAWALWFANAAAQTLNTVLSKIIPAGDGLYFFAGLLLAIILIWKMRSLPIWISILIALTGSVVCIALPPDSVRDASTQPAKATSASKDSIHKEIDSSVNERPLARSEKEISSDSVSTGGDAEKQLGETEDVATGGKVTIDETSSQTYIDTSASYRIWTRADGKTVRAKITEIDFEEETVKITTAAGVEVTDYPISNFSSEDIARLNKHRPVE